MFFPSLLFDFLLKKRTFLLLKNIFSLIGMSTPLYVHMFLFISIVVTISVISLILKKKEQATFKLTWLLVSTLIATLLWNVLTYLEFEIFTPSKSLVANAIVSILSNLLIVIGLISLASFVKLLVQPSLDIKQLSPFIFLLGAIFGLRIAHFVLAELGETSLILQIKSAGDILNAAVLVLLVLFTHRDLKILMKEDLSDTQRFQVNAFYFTIMASALGSVITLAVVAITKTPMLLSLNYIFLSGTYSALILAYLKDPRIAFILPEKTHLVIIVNSYGVLKYSKSFGKEKNEAETIILSGALQAITSLISEFFNSNSTPELVKFKDRHILLKDDSLYFIAVFSERDSKLLRMAMNETIKELHSHFGDNLAMEMEKPTVMDLDNIIEKTFYFIYK